MANNERVQAIRDGIKATFSQYEWDLIAKARNGWEELGELKEVNKIPVEEVKVETKVEEKVETLTPKTLIEKKELTVDDMKAALKSRWR